MLGPMRFDLTDLRLFLAVVDAGSITKGAAAVGLSLPAASERLRDMEAAGKVSLLDRGRRGVVPTAAGEALAHHARIIHRQIAQMRGELGLHASGLRSIIRLATNTASLTELLPGRLSPWMAAHPQIDVELKERQSGEIARAISAGLVEIGILSDAVDTTGLQLRPFAIDRLVLVAARDHELTARKNLLFAEILDQPFISSTGALQDHIDAQVARLGARLKSRVRMSAFEGICQMAADGVGIAIMPEAAARRCGRVAKIASVRLADAWATRRLSVCVRSEADLTPPAQSLFHHLASGSQNTPP